MRDEVDAGRVGECLGPLTQTREVEPGGQESRGLGALTRADEGDHGVQPFACVAAMASANPTNNSRSF